MALDKMPPFPTDAANGAGIAAYVLLAGLIEVLKERGTLSDGDVIVATLSAEQILEDIAMRRPPDDPVMIHALRCFQHLTEAQPINWSPNGAG